MILLTVQPSSTCLLPSTNPIVHIYSSITVRFSTAIGQNIQVTAVLTGIQAILILKMHIFNKNPKIYITFFNDLISLMAAMQLDKIAAKLSQT